MKRQGAIAVSAVLCVVFLASLVAAQANDEDGSRRLAQLVNAERRKAGLGELAWEDRLAEAALRHVRMMAEQGELSHQFPGEATLRERVTVTGLRFNDVGENVAYDHGVEPAHASFMASRGHRENILNARFQAIGIAMVRRGGRLYVVEDFARPMQELSDEQVGDTVFATFNRERTARKMFPLARGRDLHQDACRMAKSDRVSTEGARLPGATTLVAFTTFQPEELPASAKARVDGGFSRVAIGACFARTPSYPSGTNWVLMAFYP